MSLYEDLLEKSGGIEYSNYFMMLCPFPHNGHMEEHPSMMVHDDGKFKCLSCHKSGDIRQLLQKIDKNFDPKLKPTYQLLPHWHSWEAKYGTLRGIVERAHKNLSQFPKYRAFFKQRKIEQFIDEGMFGYLDGWNLFPITDPTGKIIDIVTRASKGMRHAPRYVLHPDTTRESPYIYVPNWHGCFGVDMVYVPFGMIDAWAFEDISLHAVTGTAGKNISADRLKKELEFCKFMIVPDKGEEEDAYKLANKIGWRADVKILKYPIGTKDPDEIRVKFGKDKLREMIDG